jgi:hypothetical protein
MSVCCIFVTHGNGVLPLHLLLRRRAVASALHAVTRLLTASMARSSLASAAAALSAPASENATPQTRSKASLQHAASGAKGHMIAVCARAPLLQQQALVQQCAVEHTDVTAHPDSVTSSLPCSPVSRAEAKLRQCRDHCRRGLWHCAATWLGMAHTPQAHSNEQLCVAAFHRAHSWARGLDAGSGS